MAKISDSSIRYPAIGGILCKNGEEVESRDAREWPMGREEKPKTELEAPARSQSVKRSGL